MFLVVVPAGPRTRLVNEIALEAVEAVKARTIGVLTHADELVRDAHFEMLAQLVARPPTADGAVALEPHGWVATMNADVPGARTHLERLHTQMHNERAFFGSNPILKAMRDNARAATCDALVERLVSRAAPCRRCCHPPPALRTAALGHERAPSLSPRRGARLPVAARANCWLPAATFRHGGRSRCGCQRAASGLPTARVHAHTRTFHAGVCGPCSARLTRARAPSVRARRRACTRSASPSRGSTPPSPS